MSEIYQCHNPACTLGARGEPGHFTGGITSAQVNLLTGKPEESLEEGEDYGEGVCPNCGEKGEGTGEKHESLVAVEETEGESTNPEPEFETDVTDEEDEG